MARTAKKRSRSIGKVIIDRTTGDAVPVEKFTGSFAPHGGEVIPPPITPVDEGPTLYALQRHWVIKILQQSSNPDHGKLAKLLKKKWVEPNIERYADRQALRYIFNKSDLRMFNLKRISTTTGLAWVARFAFFGILKDLHTNYRLHFVMDPTEHFDALDELERERKKIEAEPSLMGELDNESLQRIEEKRTNLVKEFEKLQAQCPDMILQLQTKETRYAEDNWTIITFKIGAEAVNELNNQRQVLKHYRVLIEESSQ